MKKYICFSGFVTSKDGDTHYISCRKLPRFYKIDPKECIFANDMKDIIGIDIDCYIHLTPQTDGKYYNAKELSI